MDLAGIRLRGRIDRIDRHIETKRVRVLDYKTSDTPRTPEEGHLGPKSMEAAQYARVMRNGKERRWIDLQLPLYWLLLTSQQGFIGPMELGYFNLPKAADHTGIHIWDGLDEDVMDSARLCAEGVVRDIRERRFWPPAARVQYDNFSRLFPADAAECVNGDAFEDSMMGTQT